MAKPCLWVTNCREVSHESYGFGIPSKADYSCADQHVPSVKHFIVPRKGDPIWYSTINRLTGEYGESYRPASVLGCDRFNKMFPPSKRTK